MATRKLGYSATCAYCHHKIAAGNFALIVSQSKGLYAHQDCSKCDTCYAEKLTGVKAPAVSKPSNGPHLMTAKYSGKCSACPLPIIAGQQIYYAGKGNLWHAADKSFVTELLA